MGGLFKSRTQTIQQPFESNPWKPQQPFLIEGFEAASGALDSALDMNGQIGDFTADMTPEQVALLRQIQNFGTGQAGMLGSTALSSGMAGMGDLDLSRGMMRNLAATAGQDPTQRILANAQAYANDPFLQGQIDSALGDVRKAFDRDVADINSGAVASGNINSTRAGALEAIAQDDAMDRAANISSTMRGQAYQAGIDRAMATEDAIFGRQFDTAGALGASGMAGFDLAQSGLSTTSDGLNMSLTAANPFQAQAQAEIDGMRARGMSEMDIVNAYMQTIGGNYGSQGFQTTVQQKPSIFQSVLGGLSTLGGMGWRPFGA